MKKCVLPSLTIVSMLLASPLRADAPTEYTTEDVQAEDSTQFPNEEVAPDESSDDDEGSVPAIEDDGTSVGEASNEGSSAAKNRMWRNIGLAVGAVAIAVTALILVSSNDGHRHHHHKK